MFVCLWRSFNDFYLFDSVLKFTDNDVDFSAVASVSGLVTVVTGALVVSTLPSLSEASGNTARI